MRKRMRVATITLIVSVLFLSFASAGVGQQTTPAPEGTITRQQADAILEELRNIRRLLERDGRPTPRPSVTPQVRFRIDPSLPSLGRHDAPLTIVQFHDYQCPFCKRFHEETFAQLRKNFIDTGLARLVIRDLPLPMHARAVAAAEAAHCAGEQGKFWPFHELLMNGEDLLAETFISYGERLGLRGTEFKDCLESHRFKAVIEKSASDALAASISGTPAMALGRTTEGEFSGDVLTGALPYNVFEDAIKRKLPGGTKSVARRDPHVPE